MIKTLTKKTSDRIRPDTPSFAQNNVPVEKREFATWMDKQDVMKEFYISERTLYNWRQKNVIPFGRLRGKIYYDRNKIEDILKNRVIQMIAILHLFLDFVSDSDFGFILCSYSIHRLIQV